MKKRKRYTFKDLLDIMAQLRGENGCPWDKEQTHDTLKKYLLEEAYEVVDAIEENDKQKHCEELGDVLLQIVFQSQIAKEEGAFDIEDVINSICTKLINRHPHVFAKEKVTKASEVERKWQSIKKKEKNISTYTQELRDIPKSMPALMRSYKVQKKVSKVGFDWNNPDDALKKVYEEIDELKEVYKSANLSKIHEEIGDLIFAVVNVSRLLGVEPETALSATITKFIKRFSYIEQKSIEQGKQLEDMSLAEMDKLWDEAKVVYN